MGLITLFKDWFNVGSGYQGQHQSNYTLIENAINTLDTRTTMGGPASQQVLQLSLLWDRRGIIGLSSFDFNEGVLAGPGYNLVVGAGGYTLGDGFTRQNVSSVQVSLAGKATGTYYIDVDATGVATIADTDSANSIRSCDWNADTHTISNKVILPVISILLDGDDYASMLTSISKGVQYQQVGERLEAIESGVNTDPWSSFYAQDLPHSALQFNFQAGKVRNDSVVTDTASGHVDLTDDAANYVELDPATGVVSVNQIGFTSGLIPLYQVTAAGGDITVVVDVRTSAIAGTGGGEGSGHTQGTDLGTTASEFTIDTDATGSPTGRVGLAVENGDDPNAKFEFNRTLGKWQWTVDGGSTWYSLETPSELLADQELTKYIALDDPSQVLSTKGRNSSVAYEDLDLSSFITAPNGVQAVVLRVMFWDTFSSEEHDHKPTVRFKKKGGGTPLAALTIDKQMVYSTDDEDALRLQLGSILIMPVDDDFFAQYFIDDAVDGQANLVVFLLGYMAKVSGVGTQDIEFSAASLSVGAGATETFDVTGFINRGLCHYLKVSETGGELSGNYDIFLYAKDSYGAAYLVYSAEGIDPAADFLDLLPFWMADNDLTSEMHLQIVNHDGSNGGVFTISMRLEQFA